MNTAHLNGLPALPKVLVLSQTVPETIYAGSIVVLRMLRDYPRDKLLVVGPRVQPASETLPCRYVELSQPANRIFRTRFARLARSLDAFGLFPAPRLNVKVRAEIDQFAPDVVVTVMQVQPYYRLAWQTARARNLPVVLIVHDLPQEFEPVYGWAAHKQHCVNAAVYREAFRRLCVSPEMADHLRAEFGTPGDVLYPIRSDDLACRPLDDSYRLRVPNVLTIGYAGGLAYGYGEALSRLFFELVPTETQLRLYTKERPTWADPARVEWIGYAASAEETWARIQRECDIVILPYSWTEPAMQALYRTHFPSKLPEYLALGMPVLIIGPDYATGVRWGLMNPNAAETVTVNDPTTWRAALERLRSDPQHRKKLAAGGLAAGRKHFEPHTIRAAFLDHLLVAARTGR
jgi:glycosyltransferase involved in cell wall biosynthesis